MVRLMASAATPSTNPFPRDLIAGVVVFLVALPLCLGIALASDAPPFAGLLAGIIGGIVVGSLSGSKTSVSGPAAGLTAVVASQITKLGSFEAFLLAVALAGLIQVALGVAQAGFIAAFFPSSVIKGLLAAIGVILILKQIPHVLGHDPDPEGDMSFFQPDNETTLSELFRIADDFQPGATLIGLTSIAILIIWDKIPFLKKSLVPAPLIVVLFGVAANVLLGRLGGQWYVEESHLVKVPVAASLPGFFDFLVLPDFSQWGNPAIYVAAITIAAVASLETLLNLEAVDKLDPRRRHSPPSRELLAQGVGNFCSGMIGGLPVTSVIVRSSVNVLSGAQTQVSAIFHGILLLVSVVFFPLWLNRIPLSCLAAILLMTGLKLASPTLFRRMWDEGRHQFLPFIITVLAIVLTDLLIGVMIGMVVSISFILHSNVRRPLHRIVEKHHGGESVVHIELANQVSFLNKAAFSNALNEIPSGGHVLLDARGTDYIDPDLLSMIREYKELAAPARGVEVSLVGFRPKYQLEDQTQYVDYSTRELQSKLTPAQVLQLLKEGHERFRSGKRLTRDFGRQVNATATGQHPFAVVLSCIDSRTPAELIFDLGVGDIFSVRVAGNISSRKVLGSIEFACALAGAKLILVMGHTRCGAVTAAVNFLESGQDPTAATGCDHLGFVLKEIQQSVNSPAADNAPKPLPDERERFVDVVARRNVAHVVSALIDQSTTLRALVNEGKIGIVGAMYDVRSGDIEFLENSLNNKAS